MKTVNLNSVTLEKNGTPVVLMGVTDKEKEWELIATATVTEAGVTSITIDRDSSGNPFELSEICVELMGHYEDGVAARTGMRCSPTDLRFYTPSWGKKDTMSPTVMSVCKKGSKLYAEYTPGCESLAFVNASAKNGFVSLDDYHTISYVEVNGNNSKVYAIGTEVKLWGIRA